MDDMLTKMTDLCTRLRAAVLPRLGERGAREHAGVAAGGDVTFEIDRVAEGVLATHMRDELPTWAYYSEDAGWRGPEDPDVVLVVDPIDGTRPAAAGFEMACVSIAAAPPVPDATMGDVVAAVVQEVKSGDLFIGRRGAGVTMTRAAGEAIPLAPSDRTSVDGLFWALGFRGRPAVVLARVLEELIDASSVGGGVFDLGSAAYSATRVLTGQLDAYVDIGPAIIAAHPWAEDDFRRVGRGAVLCNAPYDLAAVHLLCREAGVPFGDAAGQPLDARPLLGSDAAHQLPCIVAGNPELQRGLVAAVQRGISRLEAA